jgi:hypothetical protein
LETSASLMNHLFSALQNCQSGTLSTAEISKIFADVQQERQARMEGLIKDAHAQQCLECMETPFLRFMAKYVLPHWPIWAVTKEWTATYAPAVSLNMLPLPSTPREIPYYDERFRKSTSRGVLGVFLYAAYFLLAWLGHRQLWAAGKVNGTWGLVGQAMQSKSIPLAGGLEAPLRQVYTGLRPLDLILQTLVTFFLPVLADTSSPAAPLQTLYFLASMVPIIAIFTVEGSRPRNKWTLVALPSLWAVLYQLRGIGMIAPLYFATSTFISSGIGYYTPSSRTLPESTARAILPAIALGFIVPTALLFFPLADELNMRQIFIALWQPAPVYVAILTHIFSRIIRSLSSSTPAKTGTPAADSNSNRDIPHLQTLYVVAGGISACFHLALVLSWFALGTESVAKAFIPFDSFVQATTLADGIAVFFQNDFLLVAAATLLWCLASVWDLHRVGISNVSWRVALPALVLGSLAIGPGATVAAVCYWREGALSRTSFPRHTAASR